MTDLHLLAPEGMTNLYAIDKREVGSLYLTESGYHFASWDIPDEATISRCCTCYAVQISFKKRHL